jgi:hypothetical protein
MIDTALDGLLTAAASLVLALGALAIRHLSDWLKLRADSEVRGYLTAALDRAVEYGLAEARRRARDAGLAGPAVGNVAAEAARDYAQSRVPDALARFNIDTAALDQLIRARLPKPPGPLGGGLMA